jgi:hypothetical protein
MSDGNCFFAYTKKGRDGEGTVPFLTVIVTAGMAGLKI